MPHKIILNLTLCIVIVSSGILLGGFQVNAAGNSLWNPDSNSLFVDHKARKEGDLITVLIIERAHASHRAQTGAGKTLGGALVEGSGLLSFIPGLGINANTGFNGQNATSRSGDLVANMTARVVEVLPDGTLRIEGAQGLVINKEKQNIIISGLVRPEDIKADNTVLSTHVGCAEIRYEGILDNKEKTGLSGFLQRFFNGVIKFLF
ncbi:MAG: flagellar basal body L-ring protein FlgH [Firmicutes bacterium]|jgi:flagellar L-ring protein precursor FlgH|nr:flagellar basal body L-ring protein FlgH [Bacillota bacterium]